MVAEQLTAEQHMWAAETLQIDFDWICSGASADAILARAYDIVSHSLLALHEVLERRPAADLVEAEQTLKKVTRVDPHLRGVQEFLKWLRLSMASGGRSHAALRNASPEHVSRVAFQVWAGSVVGTVRSLLVMRV